MRAEFAPLQVILPESQSRFFAEHGYQTSAFHEERSHARLNVRTEGLVRFDDSSSSGLEHSELHGTVLIKDLSKSGVAFLYHQQIFPGESFELLTHSRVISASVVRCRRIGPKCFEIGAAIESVAACGDNM